MTHPSDPDEVDRRFAELVERQFGETTRGRGVPEVAPQVSPTQASPSPAPSSPPPPAPPPVDQNFDLWLDDDVDYREVPRQQSSWSLPVLLGFLTSVGGLILLFLVLFGMGLDRWLVWLAVAGMVGGVAVLMWVALNRHPDEDDQPGAQV
ncbi:hypothetical protein [Aestuariimicrobium ganziense]|uniref:hypothetical protein n=1 Tax=Aestuariimicrobium ganziense TaxID=2773677 RepID=UPI001944198B|nr:hypothetical protein [Aestuariimicrobium ganziense]